MTTRDPMIAPVETGGSGAAGTPGRTAEDATVGGAPSVVAGRPSPGTDRLVNLRDAGGLPTTGGGVTRPGVLYRSEAPRPGDLAPSGVPVWPPRTVVDLRSAVERGTGAHPLAADGSEVHVLPLLGDDISEPAGAERTQAAIAGGLQTLYPAILEFAALGLVEILRLAAGEPGPLLVHCSAGKDRTGLAFVLLLRAADVTPDAVLADYLATGPNMPGVLRRLRHTSVLPGSLAPARAGREAAIRDELAAVSITAATAVLTLLDGYPGGARGWFADHGADAATLEAWRERFVQTA